MNEYETALAHLIAVMQAGDTDSTIVFHRDAVPALPPDCYAVVTVRIVRFVDVAGYVPTVREILNQPEL